MSLLLLLKMGHNHTEMCPTSLWVFLPITLSFSFYIKITFRQMESSLLPWPTDIQLRQPLQGVFVFFVFLSWRFIIRPCCGGSVSSHLCFSTVWTPGATWGQTTVDSFDETLILLCLPISLTLGVWHDIKRGKEMPRETEGDTDWKEGQGGSGGGAKDGEGGSVDLMEVCVVPCLWSLPLCVFVTRTGLMSSPRSRTLSLGQPPTDLPFPSSQSNTVTESKFPSNCQTDFKSALTLKYLQSWY